MFRLKNITLQNHYYSEGKTVTERILNTKKGYKACVDGKFVCMISTKHDLDSIMLMNLIYNNY